MGEEWRSIRDAMALGNFCLHRGMRGASAANHEYVYTPCVGPIPDFDEISSWRITRGIDHVGERSCF